MTTTQKITAPSIPAYEAVPLTLIHDAVARDSIVAALHSALDAGFVVGSTVERVPVVGSHDEVPPSETHIQLTLTLPSGGDALARTLAALQQLTQLSRVTTALVGYGAHVNVHSIALPTCANPAPQPKAPPLLPFKVELTRVVTVKRRVWQEAELDVTISLPVLARNAGDASALALSEALDAARQMQFEAATDAHLENERIAWEDLDIANDEDVVDTGAPRVEDVTCALGDIRLLRHVLFDVDADELLVQDVRNEAMAGLCALDSDDESFLSIVDAAIEHARRVDE